MPLFALEDAQKQSNLLRKLLNSPEIIQSIKAINSKNINSTTYDLPLTETESSRIPVGEDLLLSLYVDNYYIADLFAYKSKKNAQISLNSLFELLDFMITINTDNKISSGWFINEQNSFSLELPEQADMPVTVIVNGKKSTLTPDNYYIEGEDIYVDADIIANWFDFQFSFDFSMLKLTVSSEIALPIQQKLARSKKKVSSNAGPKEAILPWKPSNYQMISTPLLDMQIGGSTNQAGNEYGYYSILGHNDLAYLSSEYYFSGNNEEALTNVRLNLSRQANTPSLLGPLKATHYEFGDITPVKTESASTAGISRGLSFTNADMTQVHNGRTKTFSGDIQPGWDIELYRNNILIDRQISLSSGRYDFRDIALLFGDNQFKLIFYGPQGQVRTESQQIYVGENQLKAQQSQYAFSVVEVDKKLIDMEEASSSNQPGWLSTLTYKRSVFDQLSLRSGVQLLLADEGNNRQIYSMGADIDLFERLLLNMDLESDQDKHSQWELNARTKLGDHSFALNYRYEDIFNWKIAEDETQSQTIKFDMYGKIFSESFLPLDYQNSWQRRIRDNDVNLVTDYLNNQISFSSRIGMIAHGISYQTSNQTEQSIMDGVVRYQTAMGPLYTRLQASYNIKPKLEAVQYKLDLSLPLSVNVDSQLGFRYQALTEKYDSQLSLNWNFDWFSANTNVSYDSDDNWSIGLNTRFSFGYEPVAEEYLFSNRAFSANGTLMARVFTDDNLNGKFDEGEKLLEGVKVKALQSHRQAKTTSDGIATLKSLPQNNRTDIVIDKKTIADPFIIPATPGISITPRKGFVEVIDIPLVNAGELEGTVYLRDKQGNEQVAAYLTVSLSNSQGKIIATTETEFDGYYLFTELPPGKYRVTIDNDDIKRKNLHDVEALEFDFSAQGDVVAGADFVIDKYTFVKGYVVDLGSFNSLEMLKIYWQIIKDNYNNALQQQVFYTEMSAEQKFNLHAAFFKSEAQATRACTYLAERRINCSVKEFEFNL